ncbi:11030_t:CDS:2 [Rhizophagus irregularis]|nr:11030_t:CDS:2 [Rhizophagus irregularis]
MPILPATDINGTFNFALARIMQKVENYTNHGSDFEATSNGHTTPDADKDKKTKKVKEQIPARTHILRIDMMVQVNHRRYLQEKMQHRIVIEMLNEAEAIRYDGHIIIQEIGAMGCEDDIDPIPYNLDKLASNLGAEKCKVQECSNLQHLW